jgi:MFS family permease
MLVPVVGVQIFAAPIMGHYLYSVGSRKIIALGMVCLTVGSLVLALFNSNLIVFLIIGLPIGFGFITLTGAPMRYLVLTETSSNDHGAGQGIINMISSFGQIIGGALIGGLIASYNGGITGYNLTLYMIMIIGIFALILTSQLKTRNQQIVTMNKNL